MKHLCLTRQTILFETWNNIVSSGKQPCWRSETLQLAIRYINLHSFTSSLSRKATIATVLFCTVIRSGNIRNNTLPGDSVSKRKHISSERHQSGFGELPEKGLPSHHLAFWRKDGHCGAIRLTECHFVTSDSGNSPWCFLLFPFLFIRRDLNTDRAYKDIRTNRKSPSVPSATGSTAPQGILR